MEYFFYVFTRFISLLCTLTSFALLIRMVLEFFTDGESKFADFICLITAPILSISAFVLGLFGFKEGTDTSVIFLSLLIIWITEQCITTIT